jgi:hypothetical protein
MLNLRGDEIHTDPLLYAILVVPVSLIAPPITHWAHGNLGGGFASLAGNGSAFLVGGVLGAVIGPNGCEPENHTLCAVHGGILGAALLQGFWALIDVNELAELPARRDALSRRQRSPSFVLRTVELDPRGSVRLRASF